MNELQIFNYNNNEVRTVQRDGEPWFVLKDVCQVLGMSNPTMVADRLDEDERAKLDLGRQGQSWVINESGLYNVILRSDKPEAKPFRKWVTSEILPTIRKHGMYATAETVEKMLSDPDAMIQVFTALKEERAARQALADKVEQDKPKVLFADSVAAASTSILVGELAKLLKQNGVDIGQNRLFRWMREQGYLISRKGADFNMPTQKSMELGLFEIKETAITHADGHTSVNKTPKVTGKGQQYFVEKFLKGR